MLQMLHQTWKISFAQERGVALMIMSQNICVRTRTDLTCMWFKTSNFLFLVTIVDCLEMRQSTLVTLNSVIFH